MAAVSPFQRASFVARPTNLNVKALPKAPKATWWAKSSHWGAAAPQSCRLRRSPLVLPQCWDEKGENRKQFQTPQQHTDGHNPLGGVW